MQMGMQKRMLMRGKGLACCKTCGCQGLIGQNKEVLRHRYSAPTPSFLPTAAATQPLLQLEAGETGVRSAVLEAAVHTVCRQDLPNRHTALKQARKTEAASSCRQSKLKAKQYTALNVKHAACMMHFLKQLLVQ